MIEPWDRDAYRDGAGGGMPIRVVRGRKPLPLCERFVKPVDQLRREDGSGAVL